VHKYKEPLKRFLREYVWVITALIFFVTWKFFLISTLWENRTLPPEPDDSLVYILHIDSSLRCPDLLSCPDQAFSFDTYAGFDHLSYRVFLGLLGRIFSLDAIEAYFFGFYIGTVALAFVLVLFLKQLTNSIPITATSLASLALYNGTGSYHGFFWVVPSFFSLLLAYALLAILIKRDFGRREIVAIAIIVPLSIYTHILSLYFLLIPPIFFILLWMFTRKFPASGFKKTGIALCIALCSYIPVALYFSNISYGNPYGPDIILKHVAEKSKALPETLQSKSGQATFETTNIKAKTALESDPLFATKRFPGWEPIKNNYFHWLFPHWIGYVVYVACIFLLLFFHKYRTLSLYFSSVIFTLASTVSPFGERSLLFLWPATFILYGQAAYLGFRFSRSHIRSPLQQRILQGILVIAIILFIALNGTYSYTWNRSRNTMRDIDESFEATRRLTALVKRGEKVAYSDDMNYLDNLAFLTERKKKPDKTIVLKEATYYVDLDPQRKELDTKPNLFPYSIFNFIPTTKETRNKTVSIEKFNVASVRLTPIDQIDSIRIFRVQPLP
jgi:hypothetical protein